MSGNKTVKFKLKKLINRQLIYIQLYRSFRQCPSERCRCFVVEGMTTYPETTTKPLTTTTPTPGDKIDPSQWVCKLIPPYNKGTPDKIRGMKQWCRDNCLTPDPRHR